MMMMTGDEREQTSLNDMLRRTTSGKVRTREMQKGIFRAHAFGRRVVNARMNEVKGERGGGARARASWSFDDERSSEGVGGNGNANDRGENGRMGLREEYARARERERTRDGDVGFGSRRGKAASDGRFGMKDFSSRRDDDAPRYDRRAMRKELGRDPTIKESLVGEIVYGANAVREALRQNRRACYALYVQEGDGGAGADEDVLTLAKGLKVEIKRASKHDLNMLCDNRPHQGVVLDAEALETPALEELPKWDSTGLPPVWLALDEIMDPQNLGAMLRSAHFLGVDGVVYCAKNSAPFNGTTSKASSGAMEAQLVHQTSVMHRFLAKARDDGWDVVGASAESRAIDVRDFTVSSPTVLVMGNEGAGLRTNVRRACARLVKIPAGASASPGVDSLNVSVAAGILVHHFLAARRVNSV